MQINAPTSKQLSYLRKLAEQTGTTFTLPRTAAEASRMIKTMRQRQPAAHRDIRREQRALSSDMATRRGDAARVRSKELKGYGSSAGWK